MEEPLKEFCQTLIGKGSFNGIVSGGPLSRDSEELVSFLIKTADFQFLQRIEIKTLGSQELRFIMRGCFYKLGVKGQPEIELVIHDIHDGVSGGDITMIGTMEAYQYLLDKLSYNKDLI